jgi:hypothetical protein
VRAVFISALPSSQHVTALDIMIQGDSGAANGGTGGILSSEPRCQTIQQIERYAAHPDDFLDWDKPLNEQSEKVRGVLQQSTSSKGLGHALTRDTEALSRFSQGGPGADQPNRFVGGPSGRVMREGMGSVVDNGQILDPVVGLVPVDMMNVLGGKQVAPKVSSHNAAMLFDKSPVVGSDLVSFGVSSSGASRGSVAGRATEGSAIGLDIVPMPLELSRALRTNEIDQGRPLGDWMPKDNDTTKWLKSKGVAGTKYLDQGSRTAGEGSRNYVVFDDKLIDILRKYGIIGALGLGAASAPYGPSPASASTRRPFPGDLN